MSGIFDDEEIGVNIFDRLTFPDAPTPKEESFGKTFLASFKRENELVQKGLAVQTSWGMSSTDFETDPNHNPYEGLEEKYAPYLSEFQGSRNANDTALIKSRLDEQIENYRIQSEGNTWGAVLGGLAGSLTSPSGYVAGFGLTKSLLKSTSILKAATGGAALGFIASAPTEGILQTLDPTRTAYESVVNIAGGVALGSLVGAGLGKLNSKTQQNMINEMMSDTPAEIPLSKVMTYDLNDSASAARALDPASEVSLAWESGHLKTRIAKNLAPVLRGLTSESPAARRITNKFVNHYYTLDKNLRGEATEISVETVTEMNRNRIVPVFRELKAAQADSGIKDLTEWNRLVASELRRPGSISNESVKRAADGVNKYFKFYEDRMRKLGILPDDYDGTGYLTRVYQTDLITKNQKEFTEAVADGMMARNPQLDQMDAIEAARDVTDQIVNKGISNKVQLKYKAGSTKARTLDIDDSYIEKFLDNDLGNVLQSYSRSVEPDLAIREAFGTTDMNKILEPIHDEYNILIGKAREANDAKKVNSLTKERQDLVETLEAFYERLLGRRGVNKGISNKAARNFLNYQYMTKMGGMVFGNLPDLARMALTSSYGKNLVADMDAMGNMLKGAKLSRADMDALRIGTDSFLNEFNMTRQQHMWATDPSLMTPDTDPITRTIDKATGWASKLNFSNMWNDWVKTVQSTRLSTILQSDITKLVDGKLDSYRTSELARMGIDKRAAKLIREQINEHSYIEDGYRILNTERWEGEGALIFKAALSKELDNVFVMPTVADKPLWADANNLSRLMVQFKSFQMSILNRTLPAMQRDPVGQVGVLLSSITIAAFANEMRNFFKDPLNYEPASEPIDKMVREAIMRGHTLGLIVDAADVPYSMMMGESFTGWEYKYGKDPFTAALGPTMGSLTEFSGRVQNMTDILTGQGNAADYRRVGQLIPYSNMFYLNAPLKYLYEYLGE